MVSILSVLILASWTVFVKSSAVPISTVTSKTNNFIQTLTSADLQSYTPASKSVNSLLRLRGGKDKKPVKEKKPISAISKVRGWLASVQPISRMFLYLVVLCSVVHVLGLPAQALFSLDITRIYEPWRPFTAMAYMGPPSMSMASSVFFLLRFGQTLEKENGPGPYAWFLLVQTFFLTILGWLLGFPFQAQAMIAAIIHVCSRINPLEQIPFQFGLVITSWQLPFCMMAIDCLSQQSLSPAWPHVLGIFTGHLYHFFTNIWPALGGKARFMPPKWIVNRLGDKPSSNVEGLDFRKKSERNKPEKRKKKATIGGKL